MKSADATCPEEPPRIPQQCVEFSGAITASTIGCQVSIQVHHHCSLGLWCRLTRLSPKWGKLIACDWLSAGRVALPASALAEFWVSSGNECPLGELWWKGLGWVRGLGLGAPVEWARLLPSLSLPVVFFPKPGDNHVTSGSPTQKLL